MRAGRAHPTRNAVARSAASHEDASVPTPPDRDRRDRPMPWGNRILFWFARRQTGPLGTGPARRRVRFALIPIWFVLSAAWTGAMLAIGGLQVGHPPDADLYAWQPSRAHAIDSSLVGVVVLAAACGVLAWKWPADNPGR